MRSTTNSATGKELVGELRINRLGGEDGTLSKHVVEQFRESLHGGLLTTADIDYDVARRVWNGTVDKRPALIAKCANTADVVACVNFARDRNLLLSVRGGGHNYAGKAVCDGGLVVDLSAMKDIQVDAARRTVRAQAGLRLGEFDRETQKWGLATTLGVNTDTGISGLTLGGGYGWLCGKYGLACDNLISAVVVTSDGRTIVCNEEKSEELFWGLRGAGANFGVVTELEYKLHPVGPVLGGMVVYSLTAEVLSFFDQYSHEAPDELTTVGVILVAPNGQPAFGIAVCHCEPVQDGEKSVKPLRSFQTPLADTIALRPYVEMQTIFDEAWPPGRHYYNKAHIIRRLGEGVIPTILRYSNDLPTPVSNIAFQQLHGAASRVPLSETAFPHRYDHFDLLVHPATDDPSDTPRMISWAQQCWESLQPFAERAVYVNALEDTVAEGERRIREAYGTNYERLLALKIKLDPANLFRMNTNITPSKANSS